MKRILLLAVAAVLAINLVVFQKETLHEQPFEANQYILYLTDKTNTFENCHVVENGTGSIVFTPFNRAATVYNKASGVAGEAIIIDSHKFNLKDALNILQAHVVEQYNLENAYVVVGYSKKLNSKLYNNGEKINFQIAVLSNKVIIGTPLILHSY